MRAFVVVFLVELDQLDVLRGRVPLRVQDLRLQHLGLVLVVGLTDALLFAELLVLLTEYVDLKED